MPNGHQLLVSRASSAGTEGASSIMIDDTFAAGSMHSTGLLCDTSASELHTNFTALITISPGGYCQVGANGSSDSKPQESIVKKKPYETPSFRFERVFEVSALSCGKMQTTQSGCHQNRKHS